MTQFDHNLNANVKFELTSDHRLLAADEKIKKPPKGYFPPFSPKRTSLNDATNPLKIKCVRC